MIERLFTTKFLERWMSPLGKDIDALFDAGQKSWYKNDCTIKHPDSGIQLWVGNGYSNFKLYKIEKQSVSMRKEDLEGMLNRADRCVLWRSYQCALKQTAERKSQERAETIRNLAKLAYIKTEEGESK